MLVLSHTEHESLDECRRDRSALKNMFFATLIPIWDVEIVDVVWRGVIAGSQISSW
jgi:hypothetical protein